MVKKPLGKVLPFADALGKVRGKRVIAVGDEVVFNFLQEGVVPFLSVFDFRTLRKPVRAEVEKRISMEYPAPVRVEKPAGEIGGEMFSIAQRMLEEGGALLVIGEEDLFALPFALLIGEGDALVYGQPGKGCVLVSGDSFGREEIEGELGEMGLVLPHGD
jgi:uncharacterized protein (UPF0218 family)